MPKKIVEQIGLGQVVDLIGAPQPHGDWKAPMGEMRKKFALRNQSRHGNQFPAGATPQQHRGPVEIRYLIAELQRMQPGNELRRRIIRQQRRLSPQQLGPPVMLSGSVSLVMLFDRVVGARFGIVAAQLSAFRSRRFGQIHWGLRGCDRPGRRWPAADGLKAALPVIRFRSSWR